MSYISELSVRGGVAVEDFVKVVVQAIEDGKITGDEFAALQKYYSRLSPGEQGTVAEALIRSNLFSSPYESLQNILTRGEYDDFKRAVTVKAGS